MAVSIRRYVELEKKRREDARFEYAQIAQTLTDIGPYYIRFIVAGLSSEKNIAPVNVPALEMASDVVEHALADAETLIRNRTAVSGLDRVHTAFHLKAACVGASLPLPRSRFSDGAL